MKHSYLPTLTLILLIQGCGSDSGESTIAVSQPIQFDVVGTLKNDCGQEQAFTQYTIYLQDENWNVLSTYQADQNGQVTIETFNDDLTFTLVAETQMGEGLVGLDVNSFVDVPSNADYFYEATFDSLKANENCECVSRDIILRHRSFVEKQTDDASAPVMNWISQDNQQSLFQSTEVCRVIGEPWPLHSFTVFGSSLQEQLTGSSELTREFDDGSEQGIEISAIEIAAPYPIIIQHDRTTLSQLFQVNEHFTVALSSDGDVAPVFDSHRFVDEALHKSVTKDNLASIRSLFGISTYDVNRQVINSDILLALDNQLPLIHPELDFENYSELGEDGQYDYSESESDVLSIAFIYDVKDDTNQTIPVSWSLFGPLQGLLPMTVGLDDISQVVDSSSDVTTTTITLYNSANTNRYDDYIRHFMGNTNHAITADMVWYELNLQF